MSQFPSRKEVERIKKMYPKGTRIQIERMNDPYHPIERGTKGTVDHVNDVKNIFIGNDSLTTTVVESTMECANIIHIVNCAFCATLNRMIRIVHPLNLNSCTLGIHLFDAFYFFWTRELTHKIPPLHRYIEAFFFLDIIGFIHHLNFNLPAVRGIPEADVNCTECVSLDFSLLKPL